MMKISSRYISRSEKRMQTIYYLTGSSKIGENLGITSNLWLQIKHMKCIMTLFSSSDNSER